MKVFYISKVFYSKDVIDEFHVTMFHGEALWWSHEEPEPQKEIASIHNPIEKKLKVIQTGNNVPELFWPAHNFIISERIKNSIGTVESVMFREIEFTKLCHCDYREGELLVDHESENDDFHGTWIEKFGESDPQKLLSLLPDVKKYHDQLPPYWELLGAKSYAIESEYSGAVETVFENYPLPDWKVCLSNEAFEKYPIIYGTGVLLPDGPLAEILLPHFVAPYFRIEELDF